MITKNYIYVHLDLKIDRVAVCLIEPTKMQPNIFIVTTDINKSSDCSNQKFNFNVDLVSEVTPCSGMNDPSVVHQEYVKSVNLC